MRRLFQLSHMSAGFVAVLVGYTSSAAIVFQAANAAGGSTAHVASWLLALGIGMGLSSMGLSLYYKSPVLTAWSTPGAAMLTTTLVGLPMSDAIGVFLVCSALIVVFGLAGWVDALMRLIPKSLASAMLAGVLLKFALAAFVVAQEQTALVGAMLAAFLAGRALGSRYTIPLTLVAGLLWAWYAQLIHMQALSWQVATPIFTVPTFNWQAILGIALPLFVVTMSSQNIPGLAVLRANGYNTPASPLITWTGVTGLLLAPFGGFAFNLAAITAAMCMSPDADKDASQRWRASVWAGLFYVTLGLLGTAVTALFTGLPTALVVAIAGIALLGTISTSLSVALATACEREAAFLTFAITASGVSLWGIGSPLWGLVAGLVVLRVVKASAT